MQRFFITAVLCLSLASLGFGKPALRIKFPRGATKVSIKGKLNGYNDSAKYILKLRAGQRLKISGDRSISLIILDPAGEDPMDRDLGCNGKADISPTLAGDYKIEVVECGKADPWRGAFRLSVSAK